MKLRVASAAAWPSPIRSLAEDHVDHETRLGVMSQFVEVISQFEEGRFDLLSQFDEVLPDGSQAVDAFSQLLRIRRLSSSVKVTHS